jgi:hypothetical protein
LSCLETHATITTELATFGNACQNVHHVNKRMPTRLLNESWPLVQRGKKVSF